MVMRSYLTEDSVINCSDSSVKLTPSVKYQGCKCYEGSLAQDFQLTWFKLV